RQLSLAADLSLLPLSRDRSGSPERAGLWARMACSRNSEHSPWPGRSGLRGNHFEAGALGLLCTRMELPPWPGSLGSSSRPVAPTQLDGLHVSRLAARPGLRNRPPGLPAPQPSAPGFSGDKAVQACTPAGFGVRSLARRCPCLAQGGHISRPIRWAAGPGTHRGRSDNTDWHLVFPGWQSLDEPRDQRVMTLRAREFHGSSLESSIWGRRAWLGNYVGACLIPSSSHH